MWVARYTNLRFGRFRGLSNEEIAFADVPVRQPSLLPPAANHDRPALTMALTDVDINIRGPRAKWKRRARMTSPCMAAPSALLLQGGEALLPEAAVCMGWYRLCPERSPLNSRPVWHHMSVSGRWLAHDGNAWLCQAESNLGQPRGSLKLGSGDPGDGCVDSIWQSTSGARGWIAQPTLTCRAATLDEMREGIADAEAAVREGMARHPPPAALILEGGDIRRSRTILGWYRLERERVINLRPVWRHVRTHPARLLTQTRPSLTQPSRDCFQADKDDLCLAYDGADWVVLSDAQNQRRADCAQAPNELTTVSDESHLAGTDGGLAQAGAQLRLPDPFANTLPCGETTRLWSVRDGADWVAQPTLRCRAAGTRLEPLARRISCLKILLQTTTRGVGFY